MFLGDTFNLLSWQRKVTAMIKLMLLSTLMLPVQYQYSDPMAEADRRIEMDRLRRQQDQLREEQESMQRQQFWDRLNQQREMDNLRYEQERMRQRGY
jgi:hypothetical protein